tara:strand:+ start:4565 stop:6805 length:2241 start_codon:yes stop_codon:yes gene_type:complete
MISDTSYAKLDSLDGLDSLDEKGKPVESRIKDVKSALKIFNGLLRADEQSSFNRARIDAMFDGANPYNQAQLNTSGQGLKTNLNFGEAQRLLDISLSAYVDLSTSLEKLVEVRGTQGEASERGDLESVVAEELTHLIRSWPEFQSHYLRLCTSFIKHGTGITYFDTPEDWKFRVGSFADILIPRQTPSSEDSIDVAIGRRNYHLHELYNFIKNPEAAAKVGWNVEEVKRIMMSCATSEGRNNRSGGNYDSYESLQAELKNNDIHTGYQNPTVPVLHYWVKEMDGSISHFISSENKAKDFMYKKVSRYEKAENAFVIFSYGVGSNGTYHSIRGLGHRIFNHIQTSNRLRCQMIDGAMLGSAVMIQPENQRALDELGFTYYGSYAVLSPNVNIIEKAVPNLSTAVQPALSDISNQLALNTDTVSTYGPNQSSPYRSQMQVMSDIDVSTRLSGASLNLFYNSWTRLLKEIVRRIVSTKKPDPAVKDFINRCAMRGVPESFIKTLDLSRTKAVRSIGNGSKAERLVALREMLGIAGSFDEVGRRNLTRDIVSTRVGHDLADRYSPQMEQPRPTVDLKIAELENQSFMEGNPLSVQSNELHGFHLEAHIPALMQLIEALNQGAADPVESLPALQAFYQHIGQTVQLASSDETLTAIIGEANQALNFAEEVINNTSKQVQKMQRDAAQESGSMNPEQSMEGEDQRIKLELLRQKAELDIEIRKAKLNQSQAEFAQKQAQRDAETALKLRNLQ